MSNEPFRILEAGSRWPDPGYRELALLELTPEHVRAVLCANLVEGDEEGLGTWSAIGFMMADGAMVELIFHDASPTAGFAVRVDSHHATEATLDRLLRLLGIGRGIVKWVNPDLITSGE
jgi:hypothetical protein